MKTLLTLVSVGAIWAAVIVLAITMFEAEAQSPKYLEGDKIQYRDKYYQRGSECDAMILQYLLSAPYDFEHKVPALMKFDADMCDAENPPVWDECPDWVNKGLGFCAHLE